MIEIELLRKVSREMNRVMGLNPPIDINTTRNWKGLYAEIEKNAKGVDDDGNVDPEEGLKTEVDKGRFTEDVEDFFGEHKLLPKDWKWIAKKPIPRPWSRGPRGKPWHPRPEAAAGFIYAQVGKNVEDKHIEEGLVEKFGYSPEGAKKYVKCVWAHMRRLYHRKRLEPSYMEMMIKRLEVPPRKGEGI